MSLKHSKLLKVCPILLALSININATTTLSKSDFYELAHDHTIIQSHNGLWKVNPSVQDEISDDFNEDISELLDRLGILDEEVADATALCGGGGDDDPDRIFDAGR